MTPMDTAQLDRSRLSSKGQLVIPKALREQAQWAAGDQISISLLDGELRMRRIEPQDKEGSLAAVLGCLKRPGQPRLSEAQTQARIKARLSERIRAQLGGA